MAPACPCLIDWWEHTCEWPHPGSHQSFCPSPEDQRPDSSRSLHLSPVPSMWLWLNSSGILWVHWMGMDGLCQPVSSFVILCPERVRDSQVIPADHVLTCVHWCSLYVDLCSCWCCCSTRPQGQIIEDYLLLVTSCNLYIIVYLTTGSDTVSHGISTVRRVNQPSSWKAWQCPFDCRAPHASPWPFVVADSQSPPWAFFEAHGLWWSCRSLWDHRQIPLAAGAVAQSLGVNHQALPQHSPLHIRRPRQWRATCQ